MSSLVLGTYSIIAGSTNVISGAAQVLSRVKNLLAPGVQHLAPQDQRKLASIHRRLAALIQPLNLCMLWCRDKDSFVQSTVVNVAEILQEVWDFLDRLHHMAPTVGGSGIQSRILGSEGGNMPNNLKFNESFSSQLDHFVRELEFACNSLNLALSLIPRAPACENRVNKSSFSPAALIRASRRIQQMWARGGDLLVVPDVQMLMLDSSWKDSRWRLGLKKNSTTTLKITRESRDSPYKVVVEANNNGVQQLSQFLFNGIQKDVNNTNNSHRNNVNFNNKNKQQQQPAFDSDIEFHRPSAANNSTRPQHNVVGGFSHPAVSMGETAAEFAISFANRMHLCRLSDLTRLELVTRTPIGSSVASTNNDRNSPIHERFAVRTTAANPNSLTPQAFIQSNSDASDPAVIVWVVRARELSASALETASKKTPVTVGVSSSAASAKEGVKLVVIPDRAAAAEAQKQAQELRAQRVRETAPDEGLLLLDSADEASVDGDSHAAVNSGDVNVRANPLVVPAADANVREGLSSSCTSLDSDKDGNDWVVDDSSGLLKDSRSLAAEFLQGMTGGINTNSSSHNNTDSVKQEQSAQNTSNMANVGLSETSNSSIAQTHRNILLPDVAVGPSKASDFNHTRSNSLTAVNAACCVTADVSPVAPGTVPSPSPCSPSSVPLPTGGTLLASPEVHALHEISEQEGDDRPVLLAIVLSSPTDSAISSSVFQVSSTHPPPPVVPEFGQGGEGPAKTAIASSISGTDGGASVSPLCLLYLLRLAALDCMPPLSWRKLRRGQLLSAQNQMEAAIKKSSFSELSNNVIPSVRYSPDENDAPAFGVSAPGGIGVSYEPPLLLDDAGEQEHPSSAPAPRTEETDDPLMDNGMLFNTQAGIGEWSTAAVQTLIAVREPPHTLAGDEVLASLLEDVMLPCVKPAL